MCNDLDWKRSLCWSICLSTWISSFDSYMCKEIYHPKHSRSWLRNQHRRTQCIKFLTTLLLWWHWDALYRRSCRYGRCCGWFFFIIVQPDWAADCNVCNLGLLPMLLIVILLEYSNPIPFTSLSVMFTRQFLWGVIGWSSQKRPVVIYYCPSFLWAVSSTARKFAKVTAYPAHRHPIHMKCCKSHCTL